MKKIHSSLIELIGNTPLLEVRNIEEAEDLKARLLVKIESFNPGGSVKDRVALAMIEDAEQHGLIEPGALSSSPPAVTRASVWHGLPQSRDTVSYSRCLRP